MPRLETILAHVRAGTPVVAASPSEAHAGPAPAQPLAGGLAADSHLAGGLGDAEAGFYARDERLAPLRGEFCVRMLFHGRAPSL